MFLNVPSRKLQCSTYRNFSWNAKMFPDISSIFRKYYIFSGHIVTFRFNIRKFFRNIFVNFDFYNINCHIS
jgi:hypothetical protein